MQHLAPTSELDAVNTILSGIGESPINAFSETTADVAVARRLLHETSLETQLEGFHWNTDPDVPLTPDGKGIIRLSPNVVRVRFASSNHADLTVRGNRVYNRARRTYSFASHAPLRATLTVLLPFEDLPEAARRYITLRTLRVYQERVLGSQTLSSFQRNDEERARAALLADERKRNAPNLLTGTLCGAGTWRVAQTFARGVY